VNFLFEPVRHVHQLKNAPDTQRPQPHQPHHKWQALVAPDPDRRHSTATGQATHAAKPLRTVSAMLRMARTVWRSRAMPVNDPCMRSFLKSVYQRRGRQLPTGRRHFKQAAVIPQRRKRRLSGKRIGHGEGEGKIMA